MDAIKATGAAPHVGEIRTDVSHLAYLVAGFLDALCRPLSRALDRPARLFIAIALRSLKNSPLLNRSITAGAKPADLRAGEAGRVRAGSRLRRALRAWEAIK